MVRDFFRRTPNYNLTVTANGHPRPDAHVDIDQTAFQVQATSRASISSRPTATSARVRRLRQPEDRPARATDNIDAARTVAGYLGVQIPNISLDAAGMTALTKTSPMQQTDTGTDHPAQRPDDLRHRPCSRIRTPCA